VYQEENRVLKILTDGKSLSEPQKKCNVTKPKLKKPTYTKITVGKPQDLKSISIQTYPEAEVIYARTILYEQCLLNQRPNLFTYR
jgi:hypothetical protein